MAVRIPGPQPTAGLERYYLDESPDRFLRQRDSVLVTLDPASAAAAELANRGTAPIGGALGDTSAVESDQANLHTAIEDQANRVVTSAAGVNDLRGDPLSPNFPAISDAVNKSGAGIGSAPNVAIGLPPPPATGAPGDGGGPGDGGNI